MGFISICTCSFLRIFFYSVCINISHPVLPNWSIGMNTRLESEKDKKTGRQKKNDKKNLQMQTIMTIRVERTDSVVREETIEIQRILTLLL